MQRWIAFVDTRQGVARAVVAAAATAVAQGQRFSTP